MRKQVTIGFKVSQEIKDRAKKIISSITKRKNITQGEAFSLIINEYEKVRLVNAIYLTEYVAPYIKDMIKNIDCEFLQYTNDAFYCFERFSTSKKKDILETEPSTITIICTMCKLGKSKEII